MVKLLQIFLILLLLFCFELSAQQVSALASVDSSDYLVGDYINYSLEIIADKDVEISAPFIRDSLKEVEIISELKPLVSTNVESKSIVYAFTVSYYDSGSVTIPPIMVKYNYSGEKEQEVLSNSVTFTVHTVPVDQQAEIKDVKEPIRIPLDWKFLAMIIFIILVLIAFALYLYFRYKKKKSMLPIKKKIVKIPAHIKALSALDNLEQKQLWQKGQVKEYHSDITQIVRNYFEDRFKLPALELTTTEQMEKLKNVSSAEIILSDTEQFLKNADLVKFAKFNPIASVNEEMMNQAKNIVNKTIDDEIETVEEDVHYV